MPLTEYAFDRVTVSFGGFDLSGFGNGDDVVTAERRVDGFAMPMGADGHGVAVRLSDQSGEVVFKLQYGSQASTILSGLLRTAEAGIRTTFPLLVDDPGLGTQLIAAPACVFMRWPKQGHGANPTDREWKFIAEDLELFE